MTHIRVLAAALLFFKMENRLLVFNSRIHRADICAHTASDTLVTVDRKCAFWADDDGVLGALDVAGAAGDALIEQDLIFLFHGLSLSHAVAELA